MQVADFRLGRWQLFRPAAVGSIDPDRLHAGLARTDHVEFRIIADIQALPRRDIQALTEGIENLIHEAAKRSETFDIFINRVKSKRFTRTRIQRMLTHIFTGYTHQEAQTAKHPEYIRLLGMTSHGRRYLNGQKKAIPLPIISRAADLTGNMGQLDIRASTLYLQAIGADSLKKEYTTPPIYLGESSDK